MKISTPTKIKQKYNKLVICSSVLLFPLTISSSDIVLNHQLSDMDLLNQLIQMERKSITTTKMDVDKSIFQYAKQDIPQADSSKAVLSALTNQQTVNENQLLNSLVYLEFEVGGKDKAPPKSVFDALEPNSGLSRDTDKNESEIDTPPDVENQNFLETEIDPTESNQLLNEDYQEHIDFQEDELESETVIEPEFDELEEFEHQIESEIMHDSLFEDILSEEESFEEDEDEPPEEDEDEPPEEDEDEPPEEDEDEPPCN